jgi:hypothetical protein
MSLLQIQNDDSKGIFIIVSYIFRIIGTIVCANKAKELNRNRVGWGFFGFIMPIVAIIWVYCMKPKMKWEKKNDVQ